MAKNGGYKIIDFLGKALSSTKVVITGIHNAIEETKKPLLLSGLVLNSVEKKDIFAEASVSSGSFVFTVYGYTVTITADDEVTAVAVTE